MQGRRRFGRRDEHGQVIPIVALLVVIITGFAAISLDAGMDYAQSRNDNDISDAAALAGTYWAIDHPSATAGASLLNLYNAEVNAAKADGCNTGQCKLPMVTVGSSTYSVAELWTTTTFTAGSSPNIYVNSAGTCSTSASGTFAVGTCPAMSSILDVGAPVSDKTTDYFAAVVGGHPVTLSPNAVAAVTGSGGGATTTNPTGACEICVFGDVQMQGSGDLLQAGGGSIDVAGYVWFDTSGATVHTTNGYGIDVIGSPQYSGAGVYLGGGSDLVNASGALGIDHGLDFGSTGSTVEGASANISGTVAGTTGNTITPSSYGTASTAAFIDPMASVVVPTYTAATTSCGSVTISTSSTTSGCVTVVGSNPATSATLSSGIYTSILTEIPTTMNPAEFGSLTIQSNVTFNSGTYLSDGTGIAINNSGVTLSGTGLTFYMTCGSGSSPVSCGTWTALTATCAATTSGSSVQFNGATAVNLAAPSGTNPVLFFFDHCNSNANAYEINSQNVTGSPTGMLYAHSGEVMMNASTNSLPSPLLVGNVYYNAGSITLGTSTGAVALGSSSSGPGNLVN